MPTKRLFETIHDGNNSITRMIPNHDSKRITTAAYRSISKDDDGDKNITKDKSDKREKKKRKNGNNDALMEGEEEEETIIRDFDKQFAHEFKNNGGSSGSNNAPLSPKNNVKIETILQQYPYYSVSNAINEHHRRRQNKINNSNFTSSPIDIVAILLSISIIHQSSSYYYNNNNNHDNEEIISLLITDPSIPFDTCCRIIFKKRKNNFSSGPLWMMNETVGALQRGDVIRFNRLSFCRMYGDSDRGIKKSNNSVYDNTDNIDNVANDNTLRENSFEQHQQQQEEKKEHTKKLPTILCEFRQSWLDPEAGIPFAILQRFKDVHDINNNNKLQQQQQSMETPQVYINTLARWWLEKELRLNDKTATNMMSHGVLNVGDILHTNKLKCRRRRRLRDIHSPNLTSDVLVRVLSCDYSDDDVCMKSPLSSSSPHPKQQDKWKKRFGTASIQKSDKNSNSNKTFVVTLFDGDRHHKNGNTRNKSGVKIMDEDNMMAFHHHKCHQFITPLQRAYKQRLWVLITNVLSRRNHNNDCNGRGGGDIVLVPTSETSIQFMEEEEGVANKLSPDTTTTTAGAVTFASPSPKRRKKKRESDGSTLTLTSSPSLSSPGTPQTCVDGDDGVTSQHFGIENKDKNDGISYAACDKQLDCNAVKIASSSPPPPHKKKKKAHVVLNDIMMEEEEIDSTKTERITVASKLVDIFIGSVGESLFATKDDDNKNKDWFSSSSLKRFVQNLVVSTGKERGEISPLSTSWDKKPSSSSSSLEHGGGRVDDDATITENNNNCNFPPLSVMYRKATLQLDGFVVSLPTAAATISKPSSTTTTSPFCSTVEASGDIMQTLCGSVPALDIYVETIPPWRLSKLVYGLLYGMVKEEVVLRWTLKRSGGDGMHDHNGGGKSKKWSVVDVMLPCLEF